MFLSKLFKHTRARVMTALAGLTMVLGVGAAITATTTQNQNEVVETKATTPAGGVIYFQNHWQYTNPYMHNWGTSETVWPGTKMTKVSSRQTGTGAGLASRDIYSATLKNINNTGIKFSDNASNGTSDLTVPSDGANFYLQEKGAWVKWDGSTDCFDSSRTIYVAKPDNWEHWDTLHIHAWNSGVSMTEWESRPSMTYLGKTGSTYFYSYSVPAFYTGFKFTGDSQSYATSDLSLSFSDKNTCYDLGSRSWKQYVEYRENSDGSGVCRTALASGGNLLTYSGAGFSLPTFRKFSSWNTASNGGGSSYAASAYSGGSVVLYAIWSYFQVEYSTDNSTWNAMNSETKDGMLHNYYTDGAITQTSGTQLYFRYTDASDTTRSITLTGLVSDVNNNLNFSAGAASFKYSGIEGYVDLQVKYESSTLKFYAWAHGINTGTGTAYYSVIVNGTTYYEGEAVTENKEWRVTGLSLTSGNTIQFYDNKRGVAYAPTTLNEYSDGFANATTCNKTGTYDIYVQGSSSGAGDIIYAERKTWTVSFNLKGHGSAVDDVTVTKGGKISAPTAPTATGYTFGGWYKENALANAWNFASDTVTADITLFAKWTVIKYAVTITAGNGVASVYLSSGTSGSPTATSFDYGSTVYGFAVLAGGYAHDASWTYVSGTADTAGAVYRVGSLTVNTSGNDFGTINAVSGETDAVSWAVAFNKAIRGDNGGVCKSDGSTNTSSLVTAWSGQSTTYSALAAYKKYWLAEATKSSNANVTTALAQYDYVCGKYGPNGQEVTGITDFMSRNPSRQAGASVVPGAYKNDQSPLTLTLWIVLGTGLLGLGAIGTAYFISKKKERHQA